MTPPEAARRLGISLNRLNEIVLGKRGITADTALRLGLRMEQGWHGRCSALAQAASTAMPDLVSSPWRTRGR